MNPRNSSLPWRHAPQKGSSARKQQVRTSGTQLEKCIQTQMDSAGDLLTTSHCNNLNKLSSFQHCKQMSECIGTVPRNLESCVQRVTAIQGSALCGTTGEWLCVYTVCGWSWKYTYSTCTWCASRISITIRNSILLCSLHTVYFGRSLQEQYLRIRAETTTVIRNHKTARKNVRQNDWCFWVSSVLYVTVVHHCLDVCAITSANVRIQCTKTCIEPACSFTDQWTFISFGIAFRSFWFCKRMRTVLSVEIRTQ